MKTTFDLGLSAGESSVAHSDGRSPTQAAESPLPLKQCRKCLGFYPLEKFAARKTSIDGRDAYCLACHRGATKKWRQTNRSRELAAAREAYHRDPEAARALSRKQYAANAVRERERQRISYWTNPEKERARKRALRAANLEGMRARGRQHYLANREKILARQRQRRIFDAPARRALERERYAKADKKKRHDKNARWYSQHKAEAKRNIRAWQIANRETVCAAASAYRARKNGSPGSCYTTVQHIKWRWEMWGNRCWMCGDAATATDHVIALAKGGSHWPANLRPICKSCNSRKGAKKISELDMGAAPYIQCADA